jgi:hypothetical protein
MDIQTIDQTQFQTIERIRQVITHDYPRKFATIAFEGLQPVGISWRSEFVEPIVVRSMEQRLGWIGVDQQLVVMDLSTDRVAIALPLSSNVVQIMTLPLLTIVLTELEVLIFNADRSLRCIKGLPDIGTNLLVQGPIVMVELLDGNSLGLNPETGVLKERMLVA